MLARFQRLLTPTKRNMMILTSGTVMSQIVFVLTSLILARIYSPADFGIFAVFMSLSTIGAALVGGRYEVAIMIPKEVDNAQAVLKLSILISMVICCSLLMLFVLGSIAAEYWWGYQGWLLLAILTPINVWLTHALVTLNLWVNRCRRYTKLATITISQAIAINGISIALGWFTLGAAGLMWGAVAGRALTFLLMIFYGIEQQERTQIVRIRLSKMRDMASRFQLHPKHMLPSLMIGTVAMQMPVFILSTCFGATVTGYYTLAQRFITLPSSMVATAIGEIYRERVGRRFREGGVFRDLFVKTIVGCAIIASIPFLIMYIFAPEFFDIAFGEEWQSAVEYARILVVAAYFRFVFTPVDKGAIIVGASVFIFCWQSARLLALLLVFAIVYYGGVSVFPALWLIVAAATLLYVANGVANFRFSNRKGPSDSEGAGHA